MKKRYLAALAAAAGAGAWCVHRNRKYPLRKELRFVNKLVVPGSALNLKTAELANRALGQMALTLPALPGLLPRRRVLPGRCGLHPPLRRAVCPGSAVRSGVRPLPHIRCGPLPAAFEDCYTTLRWVWEQAPRLRLDRARIAVGGDSAGGALAAACALRARDEGGPRLCFQLLVYPVTDFRMDSASMAKYTDSPLWNTGLNRKMWELYLQNGNCEIPEYAAPMLAHDFSGLPPAYVEVEEFDCLHDEGVAYAKALEAAGVTVQLEDVKGTFHGFDFFAGKAISRAMVEKRIQALCSAFHR